jgi:hypothetical protein
MGLMAACVRGSDASLRFGAAVESTIRYNRIVLFDIFRHGEGERCLWNAGNTGNMGEKPARVDFTTVGRIIGPPVVMFLCEGDGEPTEPDIILLGCSDPARAGMMDVNGPITLLTREREWSRTNMGRCRELLLNF